MTRWMMMLGSDYHRRLSALVAFAAILGFATTAAAQNDPYLKLKGGASFLGEWSVGEPSPGTAAYGAEFGYRWDSFGLGLLAEHNMWLVNTIRGGASFPTSVLNIGALGSFTYHQGYLQSGLSAGTSTLLIDTAVTNGAGHTGLFLEVQPVALRLPIGTDWRIDIEPLNFIVMAPVLDAIPLVEAAFRTTVALEHQF